jgi:hypothetical protein
MPDDRPSFPARPIAPETLERLKAAADGWLASDERHRALPHRLARRLARHRRPRPAPLHDRTSRPARPHLRRDRHPHRPPKRQHRPDRRRPAPCRRRRGHPLHRALAPRPRRRPPRRRPDRRGRRHPGRGAGRSRKGRPPLPPLPRRRGHLLHRRQRRHQRRRRAGPALRQHARAGPRPRGRHRAGRDLGRPAHPAQGQRRLRPQAALHRLGRHPRHRHRRRAQALPRPKDAATSPSWRSPRPRPASASSPPSSPPWASA